MDDEKKDDKVIEVHDDKRGKSHINIYSGDPRNEHTSIHINIDTKTGKGNIVDTTEGKKEPTDTECYLTTACMKHYMADFDDNCYYLDILRWFRDKFVSLEDKEEYYRIAPKVVGTIDEKSDANEIYQEIYYKVIQLCVRLIEYGRYEEAYNVYKENVIELENKYVKKLVLD